MHKAWNAILYRCALSPNTPNTIQHHQRGAILTRVYTPLSCHSRLRAAGGINTGDGAPTLLPARPRRRGPAPAARAVQAELSLTVPRNGTDGSVDASLSRQQHLTGRRRHCRGARPASLAEAVLHCGPSPLRPPSPPFPLLLPGAAAAPRLAAPPARQGGPAAWRGWQDTASEGRRAGWGRMWRGGVRRGRLLLAPRGARAARCDSPGAL